MENLVTQLMYNTLNLFKKKRHHEASRSITENY